MNRMQTKTLRGIRMLAVLLLLALAGCAMVPSRSGVYRPEPRAYYGYGWNGGFSPWNYGWGPGIYGMGGLYLGGGEDNMDGGDNEDGGDDGGGGGR